jgi:hypothetical protein
MEPPLTLLVYTFPEGGPYLLKTTFYDGNNTLATASFPITIAGSTMAKRSLNIAAFLVCIALGLAGGYWFARRQTRQPHE